MKFRLITFLALLISLPSSAIDNPWRKVKAPAPGAAESIGAPSAGCLRGAAKLKDPGEGYLLMRPSRGRNYGHPRLVQTIESIGRQLTKEKKPPLLVADLGMPRGGPTLSMHSSHQNGLDADIWYLRYKPWIGKKKISAAQREKFQAAPMVDPKKLVTTKAFGREQRELLQRFAENPEVDRILVHFAIKRELCRTVPNEAWIRKIRPWFGHDHHFHVRMNCSATDQLCKSVTDPLPPGNSCDQTLDWWFSAEARADEQKNDNRQQHPVMPELPAECAPLVTDLEVRQS